MLSRRVARPAVVALTALLHLAAPAAADFAEIGPAQSPFRLDHPANPGGIADWAAEDRSGGSLYTVATWNKSNGTYVFRVVHIATHGDSGYPRTFTNSDDALNAMVFRSDSTPAYEVMAGIGSAVGPLKVVAFQDSSRPSIGFLGFYHRYFKMFRKGIGGAMCSEAGQPVVGRDSLVELLKCLSLKGEFDALVE